MMKTQLMLLASGLVFLALIGDARGGVIITPAAGFGITWDGNEGDHGFGIDPDNNRLACCVPDNAALATNGGVPVGSEESLFAPGHQILFLNDGFYGDASVHINGNVIFPEWSGVLLPNTINIGSVAFGRDNRPGHADRSEGIYTMQFTTDGGTNWTNIGTLDYSADGGFNTGQRHEYGVSAFGGAVVGNGIRLLLPGQGTAIDEIEIYEGAGIPEPSSLALLALGLIGLLLRLRR